MGAALVYFVMLPFVMLFSLSQQIVTPGIAVEQTTKISEYLSLVTSLMLAFGLCFQVAGRDHAPGHRGAHKRQDDGRHATVRHRREVVVIAAVVTPPDPISQLMLAVPLVLLYEVSIWCVRIVELRKRKADVIEAATV